MPLDIKTKQEAHIDIKRKKWIESFDYKIPGNTSPPREPKSNLPEQFKQEIINS
jgi:hypothetical protein